MKRAHLTSAEISAEISAALQTLPGWQVMESQLVREFPFPSYLEGIEFVRRLAVAAEAMDHHPDLFVGWRRVAVHLTTHSAGGLTALDLALAQKASALACP